jgi:AraC-like DNA-binding protein
MPPFQKRIKKFLEKAANYSQVAESFEPPITIQGTVLSQWGPGDRFARVKRDTLSLSLITLGNASYEQEGRKGIVETGQIFLAHKGCSQTLRAGSDGFMHKRSVILAGASLDMMVSSLRLTEVDVITPRHVARATCLFRQSHRMLVERPAGLPVEIPAQALRILLTCAESRSPDFPGALRQAMKFIDAHIHRVITAEEIARAAGVSARHCSRLFQEQLGTSPLEFCIRQRMALARNMLANNGQSVKRIAAALGYDNPLYFSAQFRHRVGVCPSAYRHAAWAGKPSLTAD